MQFLLSYVLKYETINMATPQDLYAHLVLFSLVMVSNEILGPVRTERDDERA